MKLSDGLRTVFLAGIGAVAVTGEKSKKIIDDLKEYSHGAIELTKEEMEAFEAQPAQRKAMGQKKQNNAQRKQSPAQRRKF